MEACYYLPVRKVLQAGEVNAGCGRSSLRWSWLFFENKRRDR